MQIIYFIKELFIQLFSCFFGKRITKENASEILAEKEANYAMTKQALKDSLAKAMLESQELSHRKKCINELSNTTTKIYVMWKD